MPSSRNLLLAIAAACIGLVGVALYLQHVQQMLPCPLCVIQRYLYLSLALACIVGAAVGKPKLGAGLGLLASLGGLGVAVKHVWVITHPGVSCGIDPMESILNRFPTATMMPWAFEAYGLCEDSKDALFGVSIPMWSAISFGALTIALVWMLARRTAK
jgi:disulfide bond formation protein DsbB